MSHLREENARKAARRRFEARELINHLKEGQCQDCGISGLESCQMDFWHESGTFSISQRLLASKKRIIQEVSQCVLLCANCSRLRTWRKSRNIRSGST